MVQMIPTVDHVFSEFYINSGLMSLYWRKAAVSFGILFFTIRLLRVPRISSLTKDVQKRAISSLAKDFQKRATIILAWLPISPR